MRTSYDSKWEYDSPSRPVNTPLNGHEGRASNDNSNDEDPGEQPREPEAFEDLGDFLEEV